MVKTVNIVYYPDNRWLRYQTGSAVSVSGDALSTKLHFIVPSDYSSYTPWVEFQIPLKSEDGTIVAPEYVLDSNYDLLIPAEVTGESNGKLITFDLKFTDSDGNVIERSCGLSVYVEKSIIIHNQEKYYEYSKLVETEAAARKVADTTLQSNIDTETSTRESADAQLQEEIDDEVSERTSADTTLQSNIDSETEQRVAGDSTIQSALTAEINTRNESEAQINARITQEVSDRESADTSLSERIDGKQNTLSDTQMEAVNSGITDTKVAVYDAYSVTKQNKLTAGANITIVNDVISSTGGGGGGTIQIVKENGTELEIDPADLSVNVLVPTALSSLTEDETHRLVTDAEKTAWNSKQSALSSTQMEAVNSEITSDKVSTYDGYQSQIDGKSTVSISQTQTSGTEIAKITIDNVTTSILQGESGKVDDVMVNGTSVVTDKIANVTVPTALSSLSDDATHRLVTDTEKSTWNSKQSALSESQLNAVNSGITSAKVSTYDGYATAIYGKADKATTLAGYGITDAYTKTEVDSKVGGVFKVKGSCTNAQLSALTDQQTGDVWNITDDGTFPRGSNVVWTGSEWDKLSETVDLSAYALKTDIPTDYVSTSKTDKQTIKSDLIVSGKNVEADGLHLTNTTEYPSAPLGGYLVLGNGNWTYYRSVANTRTDLGVPTSDQQTAWDAKSTVTIRDWSD